MHHTATPPDPLLPLDQAAEALPAPVARQTVWRWCRHGLQVGERTIRPRYRRIGRRLYIRVSDLEAFGAEVAEADAELADRVAQERAAQGGA